MLSPLRKELNQLRHVELSILCTIGGSSSLHFSFVTSQPQSVERLPSRVLQHVGKLIYEVIIDHLCLSDSAQANHVRHFIALLAFLFSSVFFCACGWWANVTNHALGFVLPMFC